MEDGRLEGPRLHTHTLDAVIIVLVAQQPLFLGRLQTKPSPLDIKRAKAPKGTRRKHRTTCCVGVRPCACSCVSGEYISTVRAVYLLLLQYFAIERRIRDKDKNERDEQQGKEQVPDRIEPDRLRWRCLARSEPRVSTMCAAACTFMARPSRIRTAVARSTAGDGNATHVRTSIACTLAAPPCTVMYPLRACAP